MKIYIKYTFICNFKIGIDGRAVAQCQLTDVLPSGVQAQRHRSSDVPAACQVSGIFLKDILLYNTI